MKFFTNFVSRFLPCALNISRRTATARHYLVDLPGELLDEEERGSWGDPLPSVDTRVNEDYRKLEIWKHESSTIFSEFCATLQSNIAFTCCTWVLFELILTTLISLPSLVRPITSICRESSCLHRRYL